MDSRTITLRIDDVEVTARSGESILQASQSAGIYIPTLCSHPDLTPQGGCKLCSVEIDGVPDPVTSCTTKAEPGMIVHTKSDRISKIRTLAMELILASHPPDCTSCPVYLNCELQAMIQYIGATHSRLRTIKKQHAHMDSRNALFLRDMERCIQCGRCVRACKELRDIGALDYNRGDGETWISTIEEKSFGDARCRYCGACVEVCPTGALRDLEGIFAKEGPRELRLVPCRNECPAHIDVPGFLRFIAQGQHSQAVGVIREKVPFPLALGYVCTRSCEAGCRREKLNQPISIRNLHRHAVENDQALSWKEAASRRLTDTGRKVAVVGSGPAGLTAAYYLSRKGHAVTVLEKLPVAGGMMAAGVPSYRLPREALASEVDFIKSAGVEIHTGTTVDSAPALLSQGFDAVIVAVGTHAGRRLSLPGATLPNVTTAMDFLRGVYAGGAGGALSGRVVVLGGGNVAFDCARTARRLGASEVRVMCLEAAGRMLADKEEVEQGTEEGVVVHNSVSFLEITGNGFKATGVRFQSISGFAFDEGRVIVEPVAGSESSVAADLVIFAAGQDPELSSAFGLDLTHGTYVKADAVTLETSVPGVFAAGDALYGSKSVIQAIQSGRDVAASVDVRLGGDGTIDETLVDRPALSGKLEPVAHFDALHREEPGIAPLAERLKGFARVEHSLWQDAARREAGRCLQCDLRVDIEHVRLWNQYAGKE